MFHVLNSPVIVPGLDVQVRGFRGRPASAVGGCGCLQFAHGEIYKAAVAEQLRLLDAQFVGRRFHLDDFAAVVEGWYVIKQRVLCHCPGIGRGRQMFQALPRQLSPRQQEKITAWEVASRWRTWPAGKVFPASVSYALPPALFEARSGLTMTAHRVGIARQSTCAAALDRGLARALGRDGCEGVLRATYTDSTGSFVATVAVVVMHGRAPFVSSLPAGHGPPPGVRAVPFRGTLAARFGNRQRQITGASARGSYLILYTAGYADGRRRDRVSSNPYASSEMKDLGAGLDRDVGRPLGAPPPTPRCPGAPGC